MFHKIITWAKTSTEVYKYDFGQRFPTCQRVLDDLKSRINMSNMEPKQILYNLDDNSTLQVTTFGFHNMVYSLLTDSKLMMEDNLLFDGSSFSTKNIGKN